MSHQIEPYQYQEPPLLMVISGPSGVGKDVVIHRLRELGCSFYFVITATTRPKRPNEDDGVDYFFITANEFTKMIEQHELLEYAVVYGDYKGIPKTQARQALASGQDVMMRIDVQGAETIRRLVPEAVLIYLSAESEEALTRRLQERKTEPADQLKRRIATARQELERLALFDYVVINAQNQLDETCRKIMAIISAEKCRVQQREITI